MQQKKVPMRKCVGCNESKPQKELIRIAAKDGSISLDVTGKAGGRGMYLCRNPQCAETAFKKNGFARSLKMQVNREDIEKLKAQLQALDGKE